METPVSLLSIPFGSMDCCQLSIWKLLLSISVSLVLTRYAVLQPIYVRDSFINNWMDSKGMYNLDYPRTVQHQVFDLLLMGKMKSQSFIHKTKPTNPISLTHDVHYHRIFSKSIILDSYLNQSCYAYFSDCSFIIQITPITKRSLSCRGDSISQITNQTNQKKGRQLQSPETQEMASSSKTQVTNITNGLHNTVLVDTERRKGIGSKKALDVAADLWANSLIGKILTDEVIASSILSEEMNVIWKKYKGRSHKIVGKNLIIFKLSSEKDQKEILKNTPWNIKGNLMHLQAYTADVSLENWRFTSQQWLVKFKDVLIEHHSEAVCDEAVKELGTRIGDYNPKNCRPKYNNTITARIEMDLNKPLLRGEWWKTRAGGVTWVKYYWEKQPHNLCNLCWTILHDEEKCPQIAEELYVRGLTDEEYEEYWKEINGNKIEQNTINEEVEGDNAVLMITERENSDSKVNEEEIEKQRASKRLRENDSSNPNTSMNPDAPILNNPNNPIISVLPHQENKEQNKDMEIVTNLMDVSMTDVEMGSREIDKATTRTGNSEKQMGSAKKYMYDSKEWKSKVCGHKRQLLCARNHEGGWSREHGVPCYVGGNEMGRRYGVA